MSERKKVVLTGFGPFGVHLINNSWECVKALKESDFEKRTGVCLVIEEIPVVYEQAEKVVPLLWKTHQPDLVVHCGVHGRDVIVVERLARGKGYTRKDVNDTTPSEGVCRLGCEETVRTQLDLECFTCSQVVTSEDAGRYLCEYVYYLSLSQDSRRTLFIHVPPCESPTSKETIVNHLSTIIEKCLAQLGHGPSV